MNLDTLFSLRLILGGSVTTNELDFACSYNDIELSTFGISGIGSSRGYSDGTTEVTMVSVPADSNARRVSSFTIHNRDTVAATVTVYQSDGSDEHIEVVRELAAGETLAYHDGEYTVITDSASAGIVLGSMAVQDADNIAVTGGSATGLSQVAFASSGRIRGDMSNTTYENRLLLQSSLTNGDSTLGIKPAGTSRISALQLWNNSTLTANEALANIVFSNSGLSIASIAVGTGTALPITVSGPALTLQPYTKLGSGGPAIRQKVVTGTMSGSTNTLVSVAHGLTLSKIISATALVGTTTKISDGSSFTADGFELSFGATNVQMVTGASAGANILSQPFTVLITYEE